jgi:glycosyltransferase involved in cell wall biosynthesis
MILGCIDRVTPDTVLGWAVDPRDWEGRLTMACLIDGTLVSLDVANRFRPDVAAAGHSDGHSGFCLPLPQLEEREQSYRIDVLCVPDGHPLPGSPVAFDFPLSEFDVVARAVKRLRDFPLFSSPVRPTKGDMSDGWAYVAYIEGRRGIMTAGTGIGRDYTGLLRMWLESSGWNDSVRAPLLHPELVREMATVVLDRPASFGPVSLFSFLLVQLQGNSFNLTTRSGYQDFIWRYGLAAIRAHRLPIELLSTGALDLLSTLTDAGREESNGLTELWEMIRSHDEWIIEHIPENGRLDRQVLVAAALVAHRACRKDAHMFPPVLTRFWEAPVLARMPMSRLEYVALRAFGPPPLCDASARAVVADPAARSWARQFLASGGEETGKIAGLEPAIHVLGYGTSAAGISQNVRMSVQALRALRLPAWLAEPGAGLTRVQPLPGTSQRRMLRNVVLLHLNADLIPEALYGMTDRLPPDAYRIGFLLWEVTSIPNCHRLALTMLDEIWVPTRFIRDIYRDEFAGPITVVGKGIAEPRPNRALARSDFGLADDAFVCIITFDFDSSAERKNPLAAVGAFQRAFPHDDRVRLVIKVANVKPHSWSNSRRSWECLLSAADKDRRIVVIDRLLPFADLMRLVELADCYISLHRSEGFGYGVAEAMLLRKPVLVTDFSGTADFCSDETAWLVPSRLVPVPEGDFLYDAEGARWAEPDIGIAAERLQQIRQSPALIRQRAEAAYALLRSAYDERAFATRCAQRLNELGCLHV